MILSKKNKNFTFKFMCNHPSKFFNKHKPCNRFKSNRFKLRSPDALQDPYILASSHLWLIPGRASVGDTTQMEKTGFRHSLGPVNKALADEIQDVKEERAKEERSFWHSLGPVNKALADEIQYGWQKAKDCISAALLPREARHPCLLPRRGSQGSPPQSGQQSPSGPPIRWYLKSGIHWSSQRLPMTVSYTHLTLPTTERV